MPSPASTLELLDLVKKSGVVKDDSLEQRLGAVDRLPQDPVQSAAVLVQKGILTRFQAKLLLAGRHRGFKLGAYIIREQLGQGGMGAVYLAEHETLRRKVALKVLTQSKDADGGKLNVERFLREARAAAALDHPNIVRIHDVAKEGGVHYLVMEYVDGQTLDTVLTKGGPLPPSRAVGYVAQTAAGLQHAFEKGFVHRDIKPSNLILTKDGTVKILDMGLARSHTDEGDKLTENFDRGAVVGTADYISPEQALNQPTDIRSDIYSLGATFFTLITGKPPFGGNTTQKLLQHQLTDIPDLCALDKTLPKDLGTVAAKMMAKKPEQRYPTPADVISALAPWLSDSGGKVVAGISGLDAGSGVNLQNALTEIVSGSTKRLNKPEAARKPNKALIYGGVAAAVLVAGGSLAYLLSGSSESHTPTPPPRGPVVAPAVATNTPAPKPTVPVAATVPAAPAVEKLLFRFEPATLGTFKNTKLGRKPENGAAYGKLPTGVYMHGHKSETRSTWSVGPFDGIPAVAFANLTELKSAQIGFELEKEIGLDLLPGRKYTARVAYQTTGAGRGRMYTQNYDTWKITGFTDLKPSVGKWTTAEFTVTRPTERQRLMVDVETTGEANLLIVRDVQFLEAGAAPAAPAGDTAAAGPVRTLYALDLTKQKPFRLTGPSERTDDPTEDARMIPADRAGVGAPPAGWRAAGWKPEDTVEFAADITQGRPALALRNKAGSSAMLFAPRLAFAADRCTVRFEYMTPGAGADLVHFKFKPTAPAPLEARWLATLPGTDGTWVAKQVGVELNGATDGYFETHLLDPDAAHGLYLRAFVVTEAASATAPTAPAAPVVLGKKVLQFDPAPFAGGKFTITDGTVSAGTNFFANRVTGQCWKKTSVAEFVRCDFDAVPAVGLTNLNDDLSAQIVFNIEAYGGPSLKPGGAYVLRVTYRTSNDAEGTVAVREPQYKTFADGKLAPSPGEWRTVDVPFTRSADAPADDLVFENKAVGEGNTLFIGKAELFEAK